MNRYFMKGAIATLAVLIAAPSFAGSIFLPTIIRDFKGRNEAGGHPNFEANISGLEQGVLGPLGAAIGGIGSDGFRKPAFVGPAFPGDGATGGAGSTSFTNAADFNQWYNDSALSMKITTFQLELQPIGGGKYRYANPMFFPIDGDGFGNTPGWNHNYHFTMEVHTTFIYNAGTGQEFNFSADDDLWVYLNGKLAIDLGGIHTKIAGGIDLDSIAGAFGLVDGNTYDFDLFFAERHTSQSNLIFETNFFRPVPLPAPIGLTMAGLGILAVQRRRPFSAV